MSRSLGTHLPEELVTFLRSCPDTIVGQALLVCTLDPSGFPHPAMFSVLELDAVSPSQILLMCGAQSRTAHNLERRYQATLIFEWSLRCFYIKLKLHQWRERGGNCVALLDVSEVLEDHPARDERETEVRGFSFAGLSPAVVRYKLEAKEQLRQSCQQLFGVGHEHS